MYLLSDGKNFFNKHDIKYHEGDVTQDNKGAQEMIDKSGQMGVPVIAIELNGKEETIIGFDQDQLKKLLVNK